jgi:hypothetical protein
MECANSNISLGLLKNYTLTARQNHLDEETYIAALRASHFSTKVLSMY